MTTPRRFGRLPNPPDDRDWDSEKIHDVLATTTDPRLDQTVRQVSTTLISWKSVLQFASWLWSWIKHNPPTPPPPPPGPTGHLWADPVVLDQGEFGTCVGNAGAGWLASEPVQDPGVNETLARSIYYDATCLDGQCDSTYQVGSTSRSLAKVLKNRGRLTAYAFASSMADVDEWLDNHGPVIVGADWFDGMMETDSNFVVHLTGQVAGGHEWIVRYREPGTTLYRCRNSWGSDWGDHGDFLIQKADLNQLLFNQGGDALLAAELPLS